MKIYYNDNYINIVSNLEIAGKIDKFELKTDKGLVSYKFVKRDLGAIFNHLPMNKYFDIVTPFDYGGIEYSHESLLNEFFEKFEIFCKKNNIISSFIKFAPTYKFNFEIIKNFMNIKKVNDLIYINLEEEYKRHYSRGRKSNINKIKKLNYTIRNIEVKSFYTLYLESMDRNLANEYFYFDQSTLEQLVLKKFARIFAIYIDDVLVSSIMVIDESDCSYYFLGATYTNRLSINANALLFDEVFQILKKEKKKKFFLGGGREGVYEFKRRFSNKTLPYYIGSKIFNHNIYQELVKYNKMEQNDFFPQYRNKTI